MGDRRDLEDAARGRFFRAAEGYWIHRDELPSWLNALRILRGLSISTLAALFGAAALTFATTIVSPTLSNALPELSALSSASLM